MFFPEGFLWLRVAQRNDLNRGLTRLENELRDQRRALRRLRRAPVTPPNRVCPHCGGELAGEFPRCKNCGGEIAWADTQRGRLPCEPGKESLLIEQIEQIYREQKLQEQQAATKVWTACPSCGNKHEVSRNERHTRCIKCREKLTAEDVVSAIVGLIVLGAIPAGGVAFWFYWDPRGASATVHWLWEGTKVLLFWGGIVVAAFLSLMAGIAFVNGRREITKTNDTPGDLPPALTEAQRMPAIWIANGLAATNNSVEEKLMHTRFWVRRGTRVSKPFTCHNLLMAQRDGLLVRGDEVAVTEKGPWVPVVYEVPQRK